MTQCCWDTGDMNTPIMEESGWTISYNPELQIWVSFHDYRPNIYILSGASLLSAQSGQDYHANAGGYYVEASHKINNTLMEHHKGPYGKFQSPMGVGGATSTYDSTIEFIHSDSKNDDKTFSNIGYIADVQTLDGEVNLHNPGFTSFYVYTTHQSSGEVELTYLTNIRRVGNSWKINKFRDLAALTNNATSESIGIFNIDGMYKDINLDYIDINKDEITQKKFHDKFIGICLKISNSSNNLVTLYSTDVGMRKYFR
jgi:hypothetical protein